MAGIFLVNHFAFSAGISGREKEKADIIVAQDGSGEFRTIQEALDSIPEKNTRLWIVLVRNGVYREKISILKSNIAIVGEDRDSTRIVFPELRKNWRASHGDTDWGSAVVNIGNHVEDLTLANLTIDNNYGALYGDHDHQFAIRSGGSSTRIMIVNCNVLSDGGDTVSLWNVTSGMSYYSGCFFNGYVDFVCPRGWCYAGNCRFYEKGRMAAIWHDGSADSTSKFVVRYSSFDGVPGFLLGRNHRDGQFYLLDCNFSKNMADTPIYQAKEPTSYRWGKRYYYQNCHRDGGDYSWFRDQLNIPGSEQLHEDDITPAWTFGNRWDPEHSLPAVLPYASTPVPRDNSRYNLSESGDTLRWIGGRNAQQYIVRFGTTEPPPITGSVKELFYHPPELVPLTQYYWKIDVVAGSDTIPGALWSFTTSGVRR